MRTVISFFIICTFAFSAGAIELPAKDTLPVEASEDTADIEDAVPSAQDSVTFNVTDLLCELCAVHLHNKLSKVGGVIENKVSFEEKTAFVKYNPNETGLMEIIRVIEDAGYGASIKSPGH